MQEIKVLIGDLFKSSSQTIVNTVNCVGVMGKGIALEFKKRYPDMFLDYEKRCKEGLVHLGEPYIYREDRRLILNFPTKDHWRSVANLNSIIRGLEYLKGHIHEWGITSLAVPPLGCGEGQLEWRVVGPTLYRHLSECGVPVELYAPYGTPQEELDIHFLQPELFPKERTSDPKWITEGLVSLVEILHRIENEPYHWPVGRVLFQKIAYAATREGIPTGFSFNRGSYGPFSEEVKKATARLVNNGLICEKSVGSALAVSVGPTFPDARVSYLEAINKWDQKITRVVDLFMRLNTEQAEVVATVLFVDKELSAKGSNYTELDILNQVLSWKQKRRPPLSTYAIAAAIRNLAALGWITPRASVSLPLQEEALV